MKKRIAALLVSACLLLASGCASEAGPSSLPSDSSAAVSDSAPSETPEAGTPSPSPTPAATPAPAMENVEVSALPESLTAFFNQFSGFFKSPSYSPEGNYGKEYNAQSASDGTSNILASILAEGSCVVFSEYPGVMPEQHWGGGDPVGWSYSGAYAIYDGPTVDWIARNIFNVTEDDLAALIQQGEDEQWFLRQEEADGSYTYYVPIGGIGDTFKAQEFFWAQSDGTHYRLAYHQYSTVADPSDRSQWTLEGTYYTEMEDKVLEGKHYWSMHLHTAEIPEDAQQPVEGGCSGGIDTGTWQGAYQEFVMSQQFLQEGDSRGYGDLKVISFGLYHMNEDDVPELIIYNGFNGRDLRQNYIFTYHNGQVVYCGNTLAEAYGIEGYPGLFSTVTMTGAYLEAEYVETYRDVTYLNFSSVVDNQVKTQRVSITGGTIEAGERVIICTTEDEALYAASQGTAEKYQTMTMAELESQGWDAMEALLE